MASDAKKILLVEDEKAIRDAVAAYLEREGYWVVGVGDGQSAIEDSINSSCTECISSRNTLFVTHTGIRQT